MFPVFPGFSRFDVTGNSHAFSRRPAPPLGGRRNREAEEAQYRKNDVTPREHEFTQNTNAGERFMSNGHMLLLDGTAVLSFTQAGNFIARLRRDVRHALAEMEYITDTASHNALNDRVRTCGYALMEAAPTIDANTTLAQRCDLLNINIADRSALTEADGLAALIFGHGKEDSAASRHRDFKDGPLFHALDRVFIDFLTTTRDDQIGGRCTFALGGLYFDNICNPMAARVEALTLH